MLVDAPTRVPVRGVWVLSEVALVPVLVTMGITVSPLPDSRVDADPPRLEDSPVPVLEGTVCCVCEAPVFPPEGAAALVPTLPLAVVEIIVIESECPISGSVLVGCDWLLSPVLASTVSVLPDPETVGF